MRSGRSRREEFRSAAASEGLRDEAHVAAAALAGLRGLLQPGLGRASLVACRRDRGASGSDRVTSRSGAGLRGQGHRVQELTR